MRKPTEEQMRAKGIYNSYDVASLGPAKVWISHQCHSFAPTGYMVRGVGVNVDPSAHWLNNGGKAFPTYGGKAEALAKAKGWVEQRYGITEWVMIWGDWHDAKVLPKLLGVENLDKPRPSGDAEG